MARYIRWFEEITLDDLPRVGGKNASLGELWRSLRPLGVKVPPGFALTAEAYWRVLDDAGLRAPLAELMRGLDKDDTADLGRRAKAARRASLADR